MSAMIAPLAPAVREQLDETLEHFNANHADTVLLVARHVAGAESALDAEIVDVDTAGATITVRAAGHELGGRIEFTQPVSTVADVQQQVLAAIGRAREVAGDAEPITSMERELATTATLPTFVTSVASVRTVTDEIREIVLAGGLDGFPSKGADQFVFVMVPTAEAPIHDGYTMAEWRDADVKPLGAYYTVRSHDAAAGSITLWAVLHGHADGVGGWAARCEPGDRVAVWGPREGMGAPTEARSVLLVADSSGAAAVASMVDDLAAAPDVAVDVVVETGDGAPLPFPERPGTDVEWLARGDAAPGTSGRLLDAVRARDLDPDGLVVFAAGESREMTAIRRHLRDAVGLNSTAVHAIAYWRRRVG
ncbi:NADPH-dependent ferric siderophore reductase [Ilumatobacter fluminis]|uniref:NADPH-dependent ferric siderophore reductase n=2 Tax=Ilumatobacter fluminis TaxID=467091 RepID=A0A4R7I3V6_9ACTN|nr:NADPH-dependent ferric siderophore reductase [Ilumatobacter fluminis]